MVISQGFAFLDVDCVQGIEQKMGINLGLQRQKPGFIEQVQPGGQLIRKYQEVQQAWY